MLDHNIRKEIAKGILVSWPVAMAVVPLGLAFGLLVHQMGFAWWWAPIFSTVIYAGSMEFLALGLVTSGTGWVGSALTGFLVNFRHIFYGLTYPRHRIRGRVARAYATYALTDEVYALTSRYGPEGIEDGRPLSGTKLITISVLCQVLWVGATAVGALTGQAAQLDLRGVEFALPALFLVLALDAFASNPDFSYPAIAVFLAVGAWLIAPAQVLVVALVGYLGIVLIRQTFPRLDNLLTRRMKGKR